MTYPASSVNFFYDFFAPAADPRESRRKDALDHVADYAESTDGAWDIFRFGNQLFSVIEAFSPAHKLSGTLDKIKDVFESAGIALSIPQILTNINSLRYSLTNFFSAQDLPYSDGERSKKIAQAAKLGFIDSMNLTNTLAQVTLFLEAAEVFAIEAFYLRVVDGVYNLTGALTDGIELVGEYFKLKHYQSPEASARNAAEANKLEEKKFLSLITIAKDVSSLALAFITIVPFAATALIGVSASTISISVSTVALGLSSFWLASKLAAYFYNKIIVEAPLPMPSLRL